MFFPSIHPRLPSSCRNASKSTAMPARVLLSKKPMRATFFACCATAGAQSAKSNAKPSATIFFFDSFFPTPRAFRLTLFDYLIRPFQHADGNRQTDLLRRFEVDDEFELRRLLDGKVRGLRALENLIDVNGRAPEQVWIISAIGHKAVLVDKLLLKINRWKPVFAGK